MLTRLTQCALALCLAAGPGWAEGCAMGGAEPIPELQAINARLVAGDYVGLQEDVRRFGGIDVATLVEQLEAAFPEGFEGCVTLVQKRDIGGMVQSLVYFHGGSSTLHAYWLTATEGGMFTLLSLSLTTDSLDDALRSIR